ncbi:MAG TPA: hypothetical protein VH087_16295, partial [Thermoanaerobaculia bacterium]|nr:hypothetical protein [Thermoanaerobaculia bacterium]
PPAGNNQRRDVRRHSIKGSGRLVRSSRATARLMPLDLNKTYEVFEDRRAEEVGMLRVIDEEGEDYLYPREWFVPA